VNICQRRKFTPPCYRLHRHLQDKLRSGTIKRDFILYTEADQVSRNPPSCCLLLEAHNCIRSHYLRDTYIYLTQWSSPLPPRFRSFMPALGCNRLLMSSRPTQIHTSHPIGWSRYMMVNGGPIGVQMKSLTGEIGQSVITVADR